jgi:hypothetical protein
MTLRTSYSSYLQTAQPARLWRLGSRLPAGNDKSDRSDATLGDARGRRAEESPMLHGCFESATFILHTRYLVWNLLASILHNDILQMNLLRWY